MVDFTGNATRRAARQGRRRRRRGGYRLSIERRAAVAAFVVKECGWSAKQAAGLLCVNQAYVGLARQLSDDDWLRLARGELKLAAVYKDHRQCLAERRAERMAAACEAEVQAEREAEVRALDDVLLGPVGIDRVVDRIVSHFGPQPLLAALDAITAPHAVAAE
jgi:hypothetical protein